jgi:hypothetical protein
MTQRIDTPLAQAYISALFKLARHGNTFAPQANAMIRELTAPEVVAHEFFYHIDTAPADPFESCLRQEARK